MSTSTDTTRPIKAMCFDLDGTLVSSLQDIADATNYALETGGLHALPVEAYSTMAGNGNRILMHRALTAASTVGPHYDDVEAVRAAARASAEIPINEENVSRFVALKLDFEKSARGTEHVKPFSGIKDMLERLVEAEIPLAILSNKVEENVLATVSRLLEGIPFVHIAGAREDVPLKPDPQVALSIANDYLKVKPENVAFVGDTDVDMKTAVNAGMFALGVDWGFRSKEELLENGADVVVSHASEITNIVLGSVGHNPS